MGSSNQIKLLASLTAMALALPIQPLAGEWRQDVNGWKYSESGLEQKNSWLKTDDGKWYHFDENGMMRTGWYQDSDGRWYYLDADGAMVSGWREVGGKWYYLEESGAMAVGWKQIDGKWYYQDKNSGETMMHGYTPDGYYVDGSGAWNGSSARSSDSSQDDGREGGRRENPGNSAGQNSGSGNNGSGNNGSGNNGSGNNGSGNNGTGNDGSENNGSGNTDQGGENPWESKNPVILEQTGIVSVQGFPFAVVTFSEEAKDKEDFRYSISGKDATASVTPVTTSGDTVKIPLPDGKSRTLAITSGSQTVSVISLAEPGSSTKAEKEVAESGISIPADMPSVALTKAVIPLSQYVKFIRQGDEVFVKSPVTTVDTVQGQILSSNEEEEEISEIIVREDSRQGVLAKASDAVASATSAPPASMEGKEETATIAVQFDMVVNYAIADEIGIESAYGTAFIDKWKDLEKVSVLNKDFTLSTDLNDLRERSWKKAEGLPKYVKYLTAQGGMGTKVQLLTGKTDNTNPPELAISPSLKGESAVLELSEENESWYRSITEIAVPYSAAKTHYYQENHTLSEDRKNIVLNVDALSGPMNFAGTYEVTVKSFGFDDVTGTLNIVEQVPGFTRTWDDANSRLRLKADFSYYTDKVKTVTVNGKQLESGKFTSDVNSLYIPYGYLVSGENTFEIRADGYTDALFELEAPEGFATPKKAAEVELEKALAGSSEITFRTAVKAPESDEGQWIQALEAGHIKLTYGTYGTVTGLSLTKTEGGFMIKTGNHSPAAYNSYTMQISVPGYDVVTITFTPVNTAPVMEQKWDEDSYSLKLTGSSSSLYLGSYVTKVVLNGTELKKGESADYTVSNGVMEIFAHSFTAGSPYKLELYAAGYELNVLEGTVPDNLTVPLEAPSLKADPVLKGSSVMVQPLEEAGSWLDKVSRVTVKSVSDYTGAAADYTKTEGGLLIVPSAFYFTGTYTITVEAKGYRSAQTTVKILKTAEVTGKVNYDEERLELTADDSSYYDKAVIYLNGTELKKGEDYTVSSKGWKSYAYISAKLLTEEENKAVVKHEDYQTIELPFEKYTAALAAPELEADMEVSVAGSNKIALRVRGGDQEWWDALSKESISVTNGYYTESISGFIPDSVADQLTVEVGSSLSSRYDCTVTISVPGYRSCSVVFTPYEKMPDIDYEWIEGNLKFTSDSGYFSSSSIIYLDDEKLNSKEDYEKPIGESALTILAKNFAPGERYTVRIENQKYAPYEITVTAPEPENTEILEAVQNIKLEGLRPEIPEEEIAGDETSEEEIAGEETSEEEIAGDETSEEEITGEETSGEAPAGEEPPAEETTEEEPSEGGESAAESSEEEAPAEEIPGEENSEEVIPTEGISKEDTLGKEILEEKGSEEEN